MNNFAYCDFLNSPYSFHWIKKRKGTGNAYHYMKELKMHDTRGFKEMMRMGSEQFDQILQPIKPHIYKKCTKMGRGDLIGCLIVF